MEREAEVERWPVQVSRKTQLPGYGITELLPIPTGQLFSIIESSVSWIICMNVEVESKTKVGIYELFTVYVSS